MFYQNSSCAWVSREVPKSSPVFVNHWLSTAPEKKAGCGVENETTKSYFSSSSHFHPFSSHSFGGDVVSRATGSGIMVRKNSVEPGTPRPNRIAYKQLYISALPEIHQKFLFPAKSTWMPFWTRIIYYILIKYYKSINYIDVTKIDLFPIVQNYPLIPKIRTLCVIVRTADRNYPLVQNCPHPDFHYVHFPW